jgi:hypothetical protein
LLTAGALRPWLCRPQVKLLKCLVDGIVVDVSFNQLGGLFTLSFLEEVDMAVGGDHIFKRAIILVRRKASAAESRRRGQQHAQHT